jgi:hypothetical protein
VDKALPSEGKDPGFDSPLDFFTKVELFFNSQRTLAILQASWKLVVPL